MTQTPTVMQGGAPAVQTSQMQALWQAIASGLPANTQAQVNAQLAMMAKRAANKRYIKECFRKEAPALTNGLPTQPYVPGQAATFNLPQPNNAYARGIVVRTTLAYTLATGTGATYGLTAAASLATYDTIEVRYNRSQIKIRPYWLKHLGAVGATSLRSQLSTGSTDGGFTNDAQLQSYLNTPLPTSTGAQTSQFDIYIPFNILSETEDRGLLPCMPGETGVQVITTPCTSLFGVDPVFNGIVQTGGTGGAISAVSGTIKVIMVYSDGETPAQPGPLPYDMSVLQGTIQMQQDVALTGLSSGSAVVNRGKLNILGYHQYVGLLSIDGQQSNLCSADSNILYLESGKDSVGANVFWKYGTGSNLDVNDWLLLERIKHGNHDLDQGVYFFVEAPISGQSDGGLGTARDGTQFLDNTTGGWPAWHYGISYTGLGSVAGIVPRIEPMTIYINPDGLPPVSQ